MTPTTRADDEKLLQALRLRERGHTPTAIARALHMPAPSLRGAFWRVDNAEEKTNG